MRLVSKDCLRELVNGHDKKVIFVLGMQKHCVHNFCGTTKIPKYKFKIHNEVKFSLVEVSQLIKTGCKYSWKTNDISQVMQFGKKHFHVFFSNNVHFCKLL